MATIPTYTLNDGATLPAIGFGTYPLKGENGIAAIAGAIEAGYRLLDTAVNYENETEVGEAIRRSGVDRGELGSRASSPAATTGTPTPIASVEGSLERLGLDYLDLHLIHWPNPSVGRYPEAWRALVALRERGPGPLDRRLELHRGAPAPDHRRLGVTPSVNQIELHPLLPAGADARGQRGARHPHRVVEPAGQAPGAVHRGPRRRRRRGVRRHARPGRSCAGRSSWGSLPIPKSATPERQRQNLDVFGFSLTEAEVDAITGLGRADGRLFGGDPDTHEERVMPATPTSTSTAPGSGATSTRRPLAPSPPRRLRAPRRGPTSRPTSRGCS